MREIKFRAWVNTTGEMVDVDAIVFNDGVKVSPYKPHILDRHNDIYLLEDVVLEQFTGLHDKNGKEIYEGDICVEDAEYGDGCFDVVWYVDDIHCGWSISPSDVWEARVIGNIHENPELLESPDA